MTKLETVIAEKKAAEIKMQEAKSEYLNTIAEIIEENNGAFACEIASIGNVRSRDIIGALMSLEYNGIISSRKERVQRRYVALNPDGSINPNDVLIREYRVNKYNIANHDTPTRRR